MTKQDLVNELAKRADLSRNNALYLIDHMLDVVTDCLERGESIYLRGLGTFNVKDCPERKARDIHRGEIITVPARKAIKFKPAATLKARING